MLYGVYLSAQGADVQSMRHDVIANNLANASTTAFKRDIPVVQSHRSFDVRRGVLAKDPSQRASQTGGVTVERIVTDFQQAAHTVTGNPLDVAIKGPGFMRVRDGDRDYLTRNGRLARNEAGELVTEDTRLPVISRANTPIQVGDNFDEITIAANGAVHGIANGQPTYLQAIDLVETDLSQLVKRGDGLFETTAELESAQKTELVQGATEASGVQPIIEMLQMIEANRSFEANVNMLRIQDESLGRLLQAAGA